MLCSLLLVSHCLAIRGLGSYPMFSVPLRIKEPSSLLIDFSIVVLELATSPSNRTFTNSDHVVHPWSMLSSSCIGSDINHLQRSILFVGPSTMFPHDNPYLMQLFYWIPMDAWIEPCRFGVRLTALKPSSYVTLRLPHGCTESILQLA